MAGRFHIEELVAQDSSGVVFRALDTQTNRPAAVLRFFPFGPSGGGLRDDEQTAYGTGIGLLAGIRHPALRSVIGGGCDPGDGMPYLATEWIEGTPLQSFIAHGPLAPAETAALVTQALEVCELLSQALAEEAVWVETDPRTIIVGAEGSGRGVTFSFSPLKWLAKNDRQRGLESIVNLTECLMGWTGNPAADPADGGLGGWLKWLRGAARTSTLRDAREMLAAIGTAPPVPAIKMARPATRPPAAARKKLRPKAPVMIAANLALLAVGLGGWLMVRGHSTAPGPEIPTTAVLPPPARVETASAAVPANPVPAASRIAARSVDQVNREAAEMTARNQELTRIQTARRLEIQKRGDVFEVADRELLLEKKSSEVLLEGRLAGVRFSANGNGAKLYLEFSRPAPGDEPRGYIMRKDLPANMKPEELGEFIGKKIRLRGTVKTPSSPGRPEIMLRNLEAIERAD